MAHQRNFTGNLKQIHPDFIKYVKELTISIFEPENLVVKKINGQIVRARDLIPYLQSYLKLFNGNVLPKPKTVLMACIQLLDRNTTFTLNERKNKNECIFRHREKSTI